ncbi:hypothetical protein SASPL_148838 [Salvia splendens]|uniref:Uncharacterized protein n=1 Tax=Salvia splendens TaxID=180675 RepID=A0A8X8WBE9_SALSN|nr:hypothetical protein SASPL_148838 [Salvia splendens]
MLVEGYESLKAADNVSGSRDLKVEAKEDPDATENSSSFADTISGNENASSLSDAEVESHFIPDNGLDPTFDGFGSIFPIRKKKLTAHWRNFIHPLMWRCKWTELRIKQLESQASKYARQDSGKHMAQDKTTVEQLGSNSLPISIQSHRRGGKEEEWRIQVILHHTCQIISFSLIEKIRNLIWMEFLHGRIMVIQHEHTGNRDEFGLNDDHSIHDEDDNLLHHMLRKIELVHSRVQKLRNQLDVVLINNASRFSSSEDLSQLMGGDIHSPTFSACKGDTGLYASSPYIGDYNIEDFDLLDCEEVSSFGEPFSIPDELHANVAAAGLKFSPNINLQPQL